jgi:hypothetical protein
MFVVRLDLFMVISLHLVDMLRQRVLASWLITLTSCGDNMREGKVLEMT